MRDNGIHIRVADIIYGLMKRRFLIIMLTAAGLLTGIVLSGISYLRGEMSREYLVTSSFSVNTQTRSGLFTSGYDFPNYNDINMAQDLVDAVSYTLKSDKMLGGIIDSLGLLGVSTKDIADNLQLKQYNETQIIEVSLYWRSSEEGMNILTEINNRAPEILKETLGVGNVSVINLPDAKYLIGGRVNIILWGYMAMLGFGLGMGITLLELLMRPTLINTQDMESIYGLDILCEIADDKAYFRKGKPMLVGDGQDSDTKENFASAAHIIQTGFRKKEGPHIIYITSALRGEGKTSLLANLAIELSDLEKRVLLIDFDMRNPSLGGLFLKNIDYDHSLNALYEGEINETEAITELTGYLDIIPTVMEKGTISLDRSLFQVVEKIAGNYDYVLIDTAPVGITADPMSLNQIATAALFVARYDTASLQEIRDAVERINRSGVSILGCLINGVKVSERGIKNPVKEKERMNRAERADRRRDNKPVDLERNWTYGEPQGEENRTQTLVETFVGGGEQQAEEDDAGITTSHSFVKQLFEAQNDETFEADDKRDGASEKDDDEQDTAQPLAWTEDESADIPETPETPETIDTSDTPEAVDIPEATDTPDATEAADASKSLEAEGGGTAALKNPETEEEAAVRQDLAAEERAEDGKPAAEDYGEKANAAVRQIQSEIAELIRQLEEM